jgi:hypothetical protein
MKKPMQIDSKSMNIISGDTDHIAYCDCDGQEPKCERCNGEGSIFLPFVCLLPGCNEGFEDFNEWDAHQQEAHGFHHVSFQ